MSQRPPQADLSPEVPPDGADYVAMWADVVDACEQLLLAGLRREIGPDGDLEAAYRRWERARNEEHYQMLVKMMERIARRGGAP